MKRKNECQLTMIMWFVMFFILSACPLQALSVRFVTGTWPADVSPVVVVFGSMYCESLLSCTLEITGKTPDEEIIWNESDYEFSWTAGPLSGDGSTAEIYTGEYPGNNTITQPGRYYLTFSGSAKYWIQRTGGDGLPVREGPFYAELEPFNAQYTLTREFIVLDITSISGHGKSSVRISYPQSGDSWSDGETLYVQPCSVLHLHAVLNPDVELDGSIPAGLEWSTTCSHSIVDDDDCRNLEVHVGSTTGEFIVTAYLSGSGNRSRMMRVVVVPMALHQVFFKGKTDIIKDGSNECHREAVWQDDDLDGTSDLQNANADASKNYQPVAYASTATLQARPVFKPDCRKSNGTMLTVDELDVKAAVVKVRYGHPSLFSCNWTTPVAYPVGGNTYISATSPFHSSAVVDYHGEYALSWEIGFGEAGTQDGDLYWRHSESRHELYLTWGGAKHEFRDRLPHRLHEGDGQKHGRHHFPGHLELFRHPRRHEKRREKTLLLSFI